MAPCIVPHNKSSTYNTDYLNLLIHYLHLDLTCTDVSPIILTHHKYAIRVLANDTYHLFPFPIVPGPVADLSARARIRSVDLTWSVPQEPNGVIISYEVTYRVTGSNLVTTNTTELSFSISPLSPLTTVSDISVSAYTSIGRGEAVVIDNVTTISKLLCII